MDSAAEVDAILEKTGDTLVDRELCIWPAPLNHALQICKVKLERIKALYGPTTLEVYIKGDGTNWRDQVATLHGYKANRTSQKPHWYQEIRQYLIEQWGAVEIDGKEADDQIALRAFEASKSYVVCSPDKDLDQIPGHHWNYKNNVSYDITEEEARWFFWHQALAGDTADNIKGCWKIGHGKAQEIMGELQDNNADDREVWETIVQCYEDSMGVTGCPYAGMPPEVVALENARLVWMQTEDGRLWTPPGEPYEYIDMGDY